MKTAATAARQLASPSPISFPFGGSVFQVSPTSTMQDRQRAASCILEALRHHAVFLSSDDGEPSTSFCWIVGYLASLAEGLVDSLKLEGESA